LPTIFAYLRYPAFVRTTVDLPDDLMREVKVRAASEGRRLKDVLADAIRDGLARPSASSAETAAGLPLVQCAHMALPGEEMLPERVARVLLEEEARTARGAV
jgi:plasmid stability protein